MTPPPPLPALSNLTEFGRAWLRWRWPVLADTLEVAERISIFDRAGSLTFFAILAAVPSLFAGFSVLGFVLAAVDSAGSATGVDLHVRGKALAQVSLWLKQSLPGVTWNPVEFANAMVKHRTAHGVVGFVAAVWLGLGVFGRIDDAIRDIFGRKRRHTVRATGVMALLVAVAMVLALLINLFGPLLMWGVHVANTAVNTLSFGWLSAMDAIAAASQAFPVAVVFYLMVRWSARLHKRRRAALVGMGFGLVWALGQRLFTLYVTTVVKMDAVYGALTGVLALMLWLFYANILFLGAVALLAVLDRRARQTQEI
ncbi:MAG: YihY/virulence factor BrkB family protein [Deltaproteobacteria bacterium]|nr:YihY/virulence factor BrkB family protein [Deltaproteobacteria bacterium]